jgi:hypothetical protein
LLTRRLTQLKTTFLSNKFYFLITQIAHLVTSLLNSTKIPFFLQKSHSKPGPPNQFWKNQQRILTSQQNVKVKRIFNSKIFLKISTWWLNTTLLFFKISLYSLPYPYLIFHTSYSALFPSNFNQTLLKGHSCCCSTSLLSVPRFTHGQCLPIQKEKRGKTLRRPPPFAKYHLVCGPWRPFVVVAVLRFAHIFRHTHKGVGIYELKKLEMWIVDATWRS